MLEKLSLEDRVALVTGGGGGLGSAIALAFARVGADVVVSDLRAAEGETTTQRVIAEGRKAAFFAADVTKSEEVERMISSAIRQWGKLDILVNCAGIARADRALKPLWEITDADWHSSIDTNLSSVFFCSRAVVRHMMERKWGRIINIASGFGLRGMKDNFMYPSAKAGVINFTRSLALTLANYGIRSNAIAPGIFRTSRSAAEYDQRGKFVPIGRVGEPSEIGSLAVYLASDASDYVTGQVFCIDGGALADGYAPLGYVPPVTALVR